MGWEERNGRLYYYRKHRVGNRVISEYIGAGELAELIAGLDAVEKERRKRDQQSWAAVKSEERGIESTMDNISEVIRYLLYSRLLSAGYHTHKGQWRRYRDG